MKKIINAFFITLFCFSVSTFAQIPASTLVQIVKAEDERRFDKTLENLAEKRQRANAHTRRARRRTHRKRRGDSDARAVF